MNMWKPIRLSLARIAILPLLTLSAGVAQTNPQQTPDTTTTESPTIAPATTPQSPAATTARASSSASTKGSYTFEVVGSKQWIDTSMDLRRGEKIKITAEGT